MNHAPAILVIDAPALIYSTHRVIVAHIHLRRLLKTPSRYTVLELWVAPQLMRVCCGSRWEGACFSLRFWTVWKSLAWWTIWPCIQYTAGEACMAGAWFIRTSFSIFCGRGHGRIAGLLMYNLSNKHRLVVEVESNPLSRRRKKLRCVDVKAAASSSKKKSPQIFNKNYCNLLQR